MILNFAVLRRYNNKPLFRIKKTPVFNIYFNATEQKKLNIL